MRWDFGKDRQDGKASRGDHSEWKSGLRSRNGSFPVLVNRRVLIAGLCLGIVSFAFSESDNVTAGKKTHGLWPSYRNDSVHSAVTTETLTPPLWRSWTFKPKAGPRPTGTATNENLSGSPDDLAFQVVSGEGLAFFGSSSEDSVYALDLETRQQRWVFSTEGPVRRAPFYDREKLFFGSDDGTVYCLKAATGRLIWKHRVGPASERLLGNGRMISVWPVRTGVLVHDDVVYFAAGVLPSEGLYVGALRVSDGQEVWLKDSLDDFPVTTEDGTVVFQGDLSVSGTHLLVPGRGEKPLLFDLKTGAFPKTEKKETKQSPRGVADDPDAPPPILTQENTAQRESIGSNEAPRREMIGSESKKSESGEKDAGGGAEIPEGWVQVLDRVASGQRVYLLTPDAVCTVEKTPYAAASARVAALEEERRDAARLLRSHTKNGRDKTPEAKQAAQRLEALDAEEKKLKQDSVRWTREVQGGHCLILAGQTLYVGGDHQVQAFDAAEGKPLWSGPVDAPARGLAVADGRLVVSAESGVLHCFETGAAGQETTVSAQTVSDSGGAQSLFSASNADRAASILQKLENGQAERGGWVLILNCEGTGLIEELAAKSRFQFVALTSNARKAANCREALRQAGLLGTRAVVADWNLEDLPDAFADLVISDDLAYPGNTRWTPEAIARVVKPYGGRAFFKSSWSELNDLAWNTSDLFSSLGATSATTGAAHVSPYNLRALASYAQEQAPAGWKVVSHDGGELVVSHEEPAGAGDWTSLYGNTENTACSRDELAVGSLGVLWFGENEKPDWLVSQGRTLSAVARAGRVFTLRGEKLVAQDVYNGTRLWERELPGALRIRVDVDGGNLSLTRDGLFVALQNRCLRLDPVTGKTVSEYPLPGGNAARRWGYLQAHNGRVLGSTAAPLASNFAAFRKRFRELGRWPTPPEVEDLFAGDKKSLYESFYDRCVAANRNHPEAVFEVMRRDGEFWFYEEGFPSWNAPATPVEALTDRQMVSDSVFALDVQTGREVWTYRGTRIPNTAIALESAEKGARLFLIEDDVAEGEKSAAVRDVTQQVAAGVYSESDESLLKPAQRDVRRLVALDADTGKVLWRKAFDLTGCGGDRMGMACARGLVLLYGQYANENDALFRSGKLGWRRVTAVSAETGRVVWSCPLNYRGRPAVVGKTLVAEPRLFNLVNGTPKKRRHPVSGEKVEWRMASAGQSASIATVSSTTLFTRSDSLIACDLRRDEGGTSAGGESPGVWVQAFPACGVVFLPGSGHSGEASPQMVFKSSSRQAPGGWGRFVSEGTGWPVRHLALNLGAPGDKRETPGKTPSAGTLWLAYPRPAVESVQPGASPILLNLSEEILPGQGFFARDDRGETVGGTERPWLYTSGCLGFLSAKIPLIDPGEGKKKPAEYLVRLGFRSFPSDRKHKRVFDISLQGTSVLAGFDPVVEAGDAGAVIVKDFPGVQVRDFLEIRFTPRSENPSPEEAPILNYIEVVRTR
ncbi:MAG TPA: PQQ-binding-like beta-propeller repeat protein [Candidatus Sumerlaeota bacterium]|nr:PQQ-binding-like beta-propeller repeat protein [Candidatus Sumerlaeota bacterium]